MKKGDNILFLTAVVDGGDIRAPLLSDPSLLLLLIYFFIRAAWKLLKEASVLNSTAMKEVELFPSDLSLLEIHLNEC